MNDHTPDQKEILLFHSYAHVDEKLRDRLDKHLKILERQGIIKQWHDREILPGEEWPDAIDEHLENSDIILLLVSADFVASEYCWGIEMGRAIEMHEAGKARVIPIILKPVDWKGAPFGHLNALPKDAKPVTKWSNREAAWADVAQGIRRVAEMIAAGEPHEPVGRRSSVIPGI